MIGTKIVFTGIEEFEKKYSIAVLKRVEKRVLGKIAAFAKKDTKTNIKGSLKRVTGRLQKYVKFKSLKGSAYILYAGRMKGTDASKNPFYAIMQERGTKERVPRKGGYLTYQINGEWKRTKSVAALRPVWFMKRAIEGIEGGKHKPEIDAFMQKIFDEIEAKNGL